MALPEVVLARGRTGEHHDLEEILEAIEHEYFGRELGVTIRWGRTSRPKGKHLFLGWYYFDGHAIVINPALDRPWVPRFFVESVVYHECLHHVSGSTSHRGWFALAERCFAHYARVKRWEKAHRVRLRRELRGERR